MNNFMLSYNPFVGKPSEPQLLNYVKYNRSVSEYHQPFAGTYLLKSIHNAYTVNESFKGFFEDAQYMVIQFQAELSSGQLSRDIWAWINYGFIPPPPPPHIAGNLFQTTDPNKLIVG